ncbi:MAG: HupE/UreJ family protein [Bacteroidales bacterium]|nr:HupE/UreJ family protein [Bacteroidales bacterium]
MFSLYFSLGFEHISDLTGYDHILFLIAICAVYLLKDWKKVLVLVTAFTIGHSVTLALATMHIVNVSSEFIEFLIPLTILTSAFFVFFDRSDEFSKRHHIFKYFAAMFFGLIHGLGFSNYLRAILGKEENILLPLFSFNIGLEIGQILIVLIYLLIAAVIVNVFKVKKREFVLIMAGAVAGIALIMTIERFPY